MKQLGGRLAHAGSRSSDDRDFSCQPSGHGEFLRPLSSIVKRSFVLMAG
jgi:hypothetical protein